MEGIQNDGGNWESPAARLQIDDSGSIIRALSYPAGIQCNMTLPRHPRFSVLDLAPVPEGGSVADALRNTLDLARHPEGWGYTRFSLEIKCSQRDDPGSGRRRCRFRLGVADIHRRHRCIARPCRLR
jgi:hypothetical protein